MSDNMEELVKKINHLAHKAKTIGLTPDEEVERAKLRKEYLKLFKEGFKKNYLNKLYTIDENGNKVKIEKIKK